MCSRKLYQCVNVPKSEVILSLTGLARYPGPDLKFEVPLLIILAKLAFQSSYFAPTSLAWALYIPVMELQLGMRPLVDLTFWQGVM